MPNLLRALFIRSSFAICLILGQMAMMAVAVAADGPLLQVPRHALVVGNSRYVVGALTNPGNDAPVSYTHLDVYKRQSGHSTPPMNSR